MRERERLERDKERKRQEIADRVVRHRKGVVTALDPLEVTLGGADTPYTDVRALESASLEVDDEVSVLMWKGDLIVLGVIGTGSVGWIELDLDGSGGFAAVTTCSYRRDNGIVRFRGWASGTFANQTFLNDPLPVGFRPAQTSRFIGIQGNTDQVKIQVTSTGVVSIEAASGTGNFSLDQVAFVAA